MPRCGAFVERLRLLDAEVRDETQGSGRCLARRLREKGAYDAGIPMEVDGMPGSGHASYIIFRLRVRR